MEKGVLAQSGNRSPYTPFSVRLPAETTMQTSAFDEEVDKIRLTLLLSIPSIGQVSYPSALIASMK